MIQRPIGGDVKSNNNNNNNNNNNKTTYIALIQSCSKRFTKMRKRKKIVDIKIILKVGSKFTLTKILIFIKTDV